MAGFPPMLPGGGATAGQPAPASPPPTIPGVTQTPSLPPRDLMNALQKKPETAQILIKQAVVMLENAAQMDQRMEDRIGAALKLLKGPMKPNSDT